MLAQVDHLSGEVLGSAMEKLMAIGAYNVHLVPSTTKKGRPGTILLIDADPEIEEEIAHYLARDLRSYGYHRIGTSHVFHSVASVKKKIHISVNGKKETFPCEVKILGDPSHPLSMDLEHDLLLEIQALLQNKFHVSIPLTELRNRIESKLRESDHEIHLDL